MRHKLLTYDINFSIVSCFRVDRVHFEYPQKNFLLVIYGVYYCKLKNPCQEVF